MSKDQKKTVTINVEIVDKWCKTLSYVVTTLAFWKLDEKWPTNLCSDALNEISNEMYEIKNEKNI